MFKTNTTIVDNILLSGYLREEAQSMEIPQLVESVISVYCKQYSIQSIGASSKEPKTICDTVHNFKTVDSSEFRVFQTNAGPNKQIHISENRSENISEEMSESEQIKAIMESTNDKVIDTQSGEKHTLFLTLNGNVYSLGSNESGQCGLPSHVEDVEIPTKIPFQCKIKSIACGHFHNLFLNDNDQLLVCGYNFVGQLGISQTISQTEGYDTNDEDSDSDSDYDSDDSECGFGDIFNAALQRVFTPIYNEYFKDLNITFKSVSCGTHHSLCISTKGECYTFGHNQCGELGNGQTSEYGQGENTPFKIEATKTFASGVCGSSNNFVTTTNGEIMVWGHNKKNEYSSVEKVPFFTRPVLLSKKSEFGIEENCFITSVICDKSDKAFAIIDVYKRLY